MKNMKIDLVEGCVCDSLTIDGVEEINLTDEQRAKTIVELLDGLKKVIKPSDLNCFLQHICMNYGDMKCSDEPCPQCGDYVYSYHVEI